ncbi:MAG: NADH:flavin oxidoreductase, partial [Halioglobus sp.]
SLFPSWLSFLGKIGALRAIAGFAVQYWFYAQLESLGRNGVAAPDTSVFAATRQLMKSQKQWSDAR